VKAAVVVTTIHDCTELLDGYLKNFSKYGHEVNFYLIPDVKTPRFEIPTAIGVPSDGQQTAFLEKIGFPPADIPWNSDNRRNVGYLMALADGAEMVVSIDDDNYCSENEDYLQAHEYGFSRSVGYENEGHWYNNLALLDAPPYEYPRGFPFFARGTVKSRKLPLTESTVRINAGMWIGEPDLDAMSWLHLPFQAIRCSSELVLGPETWCPINSQNTAVHRDLMGAYYFVRMTSLMDRFGDIFQGYFALKVAKHMGWTARFGSPVVTHRRNSHVYLKDVRKEIEPILLLEELLPKLLEVKLTGTTVEEAYLSLADFIESQSSPFYSETARLMRVWSGAIGRINGKSHSSRGA
jgi:hypothetical protein